MCIGLAAFFLRQFGHAILEPPCHDKEKLLLGFNTRSKTLILAGYFLIPVIHLVNAGSLTVAAFPALLTAIAEHWFLWTAAVILGRVVYLMWKHNLRSSMIWFVKVITDPLTDLMAYSPRYLTACKAFLPSPARSREEK
jgi:glutamate-1-semialdehyde 2,1-aminomutase